jgi:hypothetical protein
MTRACVIMNQGARNGTRKGTQNVRKMTKRVKRSPDMNTRHKKTTGKHLEKIDIDNDKHLKDYKLIRESWVRQNHFIYYHGVVAAVGSVKTKII